MHAENGNLDPTSTTLRTAPPVLRVLNNSHNQPCCMCGRPTETDSSSMGGVGADFVLSGEENHVREWGH